LTSDYELHLKSSTEIKLVSVKSWFVSNDWTVECKVVS
jgi:hypothetical protein